MTSKEYELELEQENEVNSKKVAELEESNEQLIAEYEKLQSKYSVEVKDVERETETLRRTLADTSGQAKLNKEKLVNLEIDNEDYER